MTTREYLLVLAVALIGLVPSYFVYQYINHNPTVVASLNGATQAEQASREALAAAALLHDARGTISEVYQSQPQKETTGLCKNSYYMSFTLALGAGGKFSLMKRCESARDPSLTWYGVASTTWSKVGDEETLETRSLSITGDDHGAYETPLSMVLSRQGDVIHVSQTDLSEIATTTVFARVPAL